jgi:hypothetical protein
LSPLINFYTNFVLHYYQAFLPNKEKFFIKYTL